MSSPTRRWDIFCQVIDNYGDIGVCWRLARQLAGEYGLDVRLFVDELAAFERICPAAKLHGTPFVEGVKIQQWQASRAVTEPADVVIEAFACELPDSYRQAMRQRATPPVWINLEYLSAEDWVEDCHQLASIAPDSGMKKTFFFPGFTAKTGGLLREQNLDDRKAVFEPQKKVFLQNLGLPEQASQDLLVSLFCYENPALASLLSAWQQAVQPVTVIVPEGKALTALQPVLPKPLVIGTPLVLGSLRLLAIPFLSQMDYDHLLWCCDINFVRGEDSLVRGIWAEKPLVWHIYPQEEDAHLVKLDAFLAKHLAHANAPFGTALHKLWWQWNIGGDCSASWTGCLEKRQQWTDTARKHAAELNSLGNLAAKLVQFCKKTL
jgi:uncharacterized repeat protein (TIGR03837 family)